MDLFPALQSKDVLLELMDLNGVSVLNKLGAVKNWQEGAELLPSLGALFTSLNTPEAKTMMALLMSRCTVQEKGKSLYTLDSDEAVNAVLGSNLKAYFDILLFALEANFMDFLAGKLSGIKDLFGADPVGVAQNST